MTEDKLLVHYDQHTTYHSPMGPKHVNNITFHAGIILIGADVLDVGCGTGWWLEYCRNRSANSVEGFDYSGNRIMLANAKGLPVRVSKWQDYVPLRPQYDLVTMWDVLEHLEDPLGCVTKFRTYGDVVATVPLNFPYVAHLQVWDLEALDNELNPTELVEVKLDGRDYAICTWHRCPSLQCGQAAA